MADVVFAFDGRKFLVENLTQIPPSRKAMADKCAEKYSHGLHRLHGILGVFAKEGKIQFYSAKRLRYVARESQVTNRIKSAFFEVK